MAKKPLDAIDLLDADHRAVEALFHDFRQLSQQQASGARRRVLAEQICMDLTIHMRLEEEIFDPPVRAAACDDDLLDDAEVEHAGAKELIAQILAMKPDAELYDAKVTVLCDYIEHHVRQERDQMFPRARLCGLDLALLGERLAERKRELQAVSEALREDALASVLA